MKHCRQYVYDAYQKAIENEHNYAPLDLHNYDSFAIKSLLMELLERFPTVYCVISTNEEISILREVNTLTINKLIHYKKFYSVLSDFFKNEFIISQKFTIY